MILHATPAGPEIGGWKEEGSVMCLLVLVERSGETPLSRLVRNSGGCAGRGRCCGVVAARGPMTSPPSLTDQSAGDCHASCFDPAKVCSKARD